MTRRVTIAILVIVVAGMWMMLSYSPAANAGEQREFVGTGKCKICHKKAEDGEQYGIWEKSAHAKAYETLAGDEAKAIAQKKGIADPQKADECLKCHVTAHGVAAEFLGKKYAITDGVGCESCHGAGGDYDKKSVMVAVTSGETEAASVGLVIPDKTVCVQCHNEESPTFDGFDFDEMVKKIAHPIPAEKKATYKKG